MFGFIGVPHVEVIAAEGIAVGKEQRERSIAEAEQRIDTLAA